MRLALVPLHYIAWHYSLAIKNIFLIYGNLVAFLYRFFSIGTSLRTWFSPWRRLDEGYESGFDPSAFIGTLIVNLLMRIIGFIFRTVMIVVGIVVMLLTALDGIIFLLVWLALPAIWLALFITSWQLIFI